jgi:large subunit ribosomal protein L29
MQEMRDLSVAEIRDKLEESQNAYFQIRMQFATGQLKNTAQLRRARRDIARWQTVLREKEAAETAGRTTA